MKFLILLLALNLSPWAYAGSGELAPPVPTVGAGSGDVVGPASCTDEAIARFDGTTGKIIQCSNHFIDDNGEYTGSINTADPISHGSPGMALTHTLNNTANSANGQMGFRYILTKSDLFDITNAEYGLSAGSFVVNGSGDGDTGTIRGLTLGAGSFGTAVVDDAVGLHIFHNQSSGDLQNFTGVRLQSGFNVDADSVRAFDFEGTFVDSNRSLRIAHDDVVHWMPISDEEGGIVFDQGPITLKTVSSGGLSVFLAEDGVFAHTGSTLDPVLDTGGITSTYTLDTTANSSRRVRGMYLRTFYNDNHDLTNSAESLVAFEPVVDASGSGDKSGVKVIHGKADLTGLGTTTRAVG